MSKDEQTNDFSKLDPHMRVSNPMQPTEQTLREILPDILLRSAKKGYVQKKDVIRAEAAINAHIVSVLEQTRQDLFHPENIGGHFLHDEVKEFAKQANEYIDAAIARIKQEEEAA